MGHDHHQHDTPKTERQLWWAVGANMLLTLVQIIGGIISGSLSLVADAIHNFSDAAALILALIALRIGRRPANEQKTFGYKRAETIAALINLVTLAIIGIYLVYEAITRFVHPQPIDGWMVVIVAGFALLVDVFTALLTYRAAKTSMNIRAAYLHNIVDALSSIGVMIAGSLILLKGWVWIDAAITLVISAFILWQVAKEMPQIIHLLMEGLPPGFSIENLRKSVLSVAGVEGIHHIHVWQIDEHTNALEAHIVIENPINLETTRLALKKLLSDKFHITHSTLEFECETCGDECSVGSH